MFRRFHSFVMGPFRLSFHFAFLVSNADQQLSLALVFTSCFIYALLFTSCFIYYSTVIEPFLGTDFKEFYNTQ